MVNRSHKSAEYGPGTCYVEKLDEVVLGLGHGDVVDAVRMFHCGSRPTERDDHLLDEPAVYQIAQQKADQTYNQQQHELTVQKGLIKLFAV